MFWCLVSRSNSAENRNVQKVKKVFWVKEKELDRKAKTLHVRSPRIHPPSRLPVTGRPFRPEVPFCRAITPLADRRASANINVIGQLAERMEAGPSRARRHIAHVPPSRPCHGANDARQRAACGSGVLILFFVCDDLKKKKKKYARYLRRLCFKNRETINWKDFGIML